MSRISAVVRDAVLARLSDPATGLNANLAAVAGEAYGLTEDYSIDWGPKSKQFFQGALLPGDVEDSVAAKYPMVMLYTTGSRNQNLQKFTLFSGIVDIAVDVHLSWRAGAALRDFESLGDAFEDAIYKTFNDSAWAASYGLPIAYNGDLQMTKRPLEMAGEHWRQTLQFSLTFEVDTN